MKKLSVVFFAFVFLAMAFGCNEETVSLYDLNLRVNILVDNREKLDNFIADVNSGTLTKEEANNRWNALLREARDQSRENFEEIGVTVLYLGNAKIRENEDNGVIVTEVFINPRAEFYNSETKSNGYLDFSEVITFKDGKILRKSSGEWFDAREFENEGWFASPATVFLKVEAVDYGDDSSLDGNDNNGTDSGGTDGGGGDI